MSGKVQATFKLKVGMKLLFRDREELIIKVSNDRLAGEVVTNINKYATEYIVRQLELGTVMLIKG